MRRAGRGMAIGIALAASAGFAAAPGTATAQAPVAPVVLVPGLGESAGAVSPEAPTCAVAGNLATICAALGARGIPVYVVSTAPRGADATLDSTGAVAPNARALAGVLRGLPRPALVVGHSLGGLVARAAVAGEGAPAAGLLTIGTPHTGSFVADALVRGAGLPCRPRDAACAAIRADFRAELRSRGAAAVRDLTATHRALANADLAAAGTSGTRVFLVAGTWFPGVDRTGYVFPNDLLVGRSSALAAGVPGFHGVSRITRRLFHTIRNPLTGRDEMPNQLQSELVVNTIAATAAIVVAEPPAPPPPAPIPTADVAAPLATVGASGRLRPGTRLAGRGAVLTAADGPFALACPGRRVAAVRSARTLWAIPAGVLPCGEATLSAPGRVRLTQAVAGAGVAALVARSGRRLTVTIRGDGAVARATLTVGGQRLVARVHQRAAVIRVPAAFPRGAGELTATVDGRVYRAALPVAAPPGR